MQQTLRKNLCVCVCVYFCDFWFDYNDLYCKVVKCDWVCALLHEVLLFGNFVLNMNLNLLLISTKKCKYKMLFNFDLLKYVGFVSVTQMV